MTQEQKHFRHPFLWLASIVMIVVLFTGCGGAASSSMSVPMAQHKMAAHSAVGSSSVNSGTNANSTGAQQGQTTSGQPADAGPQYLIKTLKINLLVADTRKVADDLQSWITTTDARATSEGTNYEQFNDKQYNISLTFAVQATLYPKIYQYLRDYTVDHGGHLNGFNETVQDVTGDFVDTQSRLKNLKGEQARLLDLMSHAQALGDIITIEQKLSDVEGTIEQIEGHLNTLTSQVSFYNISINLQPLDTASPPPAQNGWTAGQAFHDAFSASLALAQGLASFLIWLLAFSFYIVPVAIIVWLVRRWRAHQQIIPARPKAAPTVE